MGGAGGGGCPEREPEGKEKTQLQGGVEGQEVSPTLESIAQGHG